MTMGDPNITRQKGRLFCMKQNPNNKDAVGKKHATKKYDLHFQFHSFCHDIFFS